MNTPGRHRGPCPSTAGAQRAASATALRSSPICTPEPPGSSPPEVDLVRAGPGPCDRGQGASASRLRASERPLRASAVRRHWQAAQAALVALAALVLSASAAWAWKPAGPAAPAPAAAPAAPAVVIPVAPAAPAVPSRSAAPGLDDERCPPALPQSTAAERAEPPRDRGLLWRISRDGHSSWLYGTLHVGKPHWHKLGPVLQAALRDSDVLALEIDPADPALASAMAALPSPRGLAASLRHRLDRAYRRACMAPEAMAELHPLLQATTLTVMEARWFGMDARYGAELVLAQAARGQGRAVVALETPAVQLAALVPANEAEALALLDDHLLQLEDRRARRVLQRLASAWERGDADTLADPARWCECTLNAHDRAQMARLTDQRNAAMAAGIVAQHRAGRRVLAAVGALHMTGPQALPALLARQGFRVERVPL
jgi:uncharacterized protein